MCTLLFNSLLKVRATLLYLSSAFLKQRLNAKFITSVYSNPSFSGLYNRWDSFYPRWYKINLVKTFFLRALIICSSNKLEKELKFITVIFFDYGYQLYIMQSIINAKITQLKLFRPEKCPVYLRLLWIGEADVISAEQNSTSISKCYFSVHLRIMFQLILKSIWKDRNNKFHYLFF